MTKTMHMKKRVSVLGATGSIGRSTLDILRRQRDRFEPVLFTANKNAAELQKLKNEFPAALTALAKEGLLDAIAAARADITVNGISGAAGLEPSAAAINAGSDLALANKETIVMAGPIILAMAKEKKVRVIPVDSEHSAVSKLLLAHGKDNVSEIILTASGGPFRDHPMEKLAQVTPNEARAHPTWNMGPKISVDSATMANKGLEVIEAAYLFGFPPEKIKVVIHPQSVVHSMIRLKNSAVYAQLSKPDMRLPIHDALNWPKTLPSVEEAPYGELDFNSLSMTFEKPDFERFPMLALAYKALKGGTFLPIVYNAANEIAVEAFFAGKIGFLEISSLVGYVIDRCAPKIEQAKSIGAKSIEGVLALDREAREMAKLKILDFEQLKILDFEQTKVKGFG